MGEVSPCLRPPLTASSGHPLLGAAGYRLWQDSSIRWAHPRAIMVESKVDLFVNNVTTDPIGVVKAG